MRMLKGFGEFICCLTMCFGAETASLKREEDSRGVSEQYCRYEPSCMTLV